MTCCATTLDLHSMLCMSFSHSGRTILGNVDLSQHAHFQTSDNLGSFFRCSTCITLSSIVSICAGAPRARTVQLLNDMTLARRLTSNTLLPKRHLSTPGFSGTRRQLAQHCRLLVLHGLDTINFKHARYNSPDTPTLSCIAVLHEIINLQRSGVVRCRKEVL